MCFDSSKTHFLLDFSLAESPQNFEIGQTSKPEIKFGIRTIFWLEFGLGIQRELFSTGLDFNPTYTNGLPYSLEPCVCETISNVIKNNDWILWNIICSTFSVQIMRTAFFQKKKNCQGDYWHYVRAIFPCRPVCTTVNVFELSVSYVVHKSNLLLWSI